MAVQADKLISMKKEAARELTEGKRTVYIYHDVIDDNLDGDNAEKATISVVKDCLVELIDLVRYCVNNLNAAKIWITADHGFLFQQSPPTITDKSKLSFTPSHTIKTKKRYVIGRDLGHSPQAHHGYTEGTAGAAGGMEFWIPRGTNRFHFVGGARFVHGGAMPQEVVIPLITVTQLRGSKKEQSRIEKVSVQVLGMNHKITTPKYRFELIQTEAVGERRLKTGRLPNPATGRKGTTTTASTSVTLVALMKRASRRITVPKNNVRQWQNW